MHQRGNGVQRIEQEVRLHLPLQGMESSLHEPGLELGGAQFPDARFVHVLQRGAGANDGPVGHHFPVEVQEQHFLRFVKPRVERLAHQPIRRHARGHRQHDVRKGGGHYAGDVHGDRELPGGAIEGEPRRQPQDRGRQRRPRIPVAKIEREQQTERRGFVGERRDEIERREAREKTQRSRDGGDDAERNASGGGGHRGTISPPRVAVKATD
jgi:hypothetical protein